MSENLVGLSE